jgi:hypothetical protein
LLLSARTSGYERAIIGIQRHLASLAIDDRQLEDGNAALAESTLKAMQYNDREQVALNRSLYALLHTLRDDLPAAHAALAEAIELFVRLGMRRELAEAREELARLEETIASGSVPASA